MGVFGGPNLSEDGLVLALDGANYKSFKGEVTTNLIPNPTVNAYPTTGNGWGTYNTNQYGSGTYFSIGSVASVSSNIVTMTSAHSLRTYDVMRPQSTGGGVIANTDYFIKKLSATSFTLHEYNGSQDGSQGYISSSTGTHKVYDSIANDTRISVNSTSFPTMWWGAPHLPNSGLVKELRYGEFNAIPNLPANDCIRLHYIRTDGVMDGMSYNVDCTITPGSPVTVSFYTRAATASAVGKQIQYQIYNYVGGNPVGYYHNFTLGQEGVWERQTFTFTPANGVMISYWFPVTGGVYSWDWSCMQVEQKSYVTSFVAGTRGSTVATGGGWADLIGNGNHGELVNGVREDSANGGSLVFDGSNQRVSTNFKPSGARSYFIWVKFSSLTHASGYQLTGTQEGNAYTYIGIQNGGNVYYYAGAATGGDIGNPVTVNTWVNLGFALFPDGSRRVYKNGIEIHYNTGGLGGTATAEFSVGCINQNHFITGNIAQVSIYNRALSAAEIQQNFNALRGRFGI